MGIKFAITFIVKYYENASLYWPWQLNYDNMEILIKKRNEIND